MTYLTVDITGFYISTYSSTEKRQAAFDTGFPVIVFDDPEYQNAIYELNPDFDWETYLWLTPCNQTDSLPSFVYTIGGRNFTLPASQYVIDVSFSLL